MSNDFREYSAAFHDRQNSLMHYGVKGMTWRNHNRRKPGQKRLTGPKTTTNPADMFSKTGGDREYFENEYHSPYRSLGGIKNLSWYTNNPGARAEKLIRNIEEERKKKKKK